MGMKEEKRGKSTHTKLGGYAQPNFFVHPNKMQNNNTKALSFEEVNTLKGHNKKKNKKKADSTTTIIFTTLSL
jgi:hypothetical protein